MLSAARRYDPSRGTFTTFAVPRIRGAIADAIRQHARHALPTVSLDAARDREDADGASFVEQIPDDDPQPIELVLRAESDDAIDRLITRLPDTEQFVTRLRLEGVTCSDIGEALGVTESRVSQLHKAALERLRDHLDREPIAA
jgi:RNA polymerase sigma factor (sigma-70 family)